MLLLRSFLIRASLLTLLSFAANAGTFDFRVLGTSKTSTMEKEMNEAADAGFLFASVMGGDSAIGGKEVVVVMQKDSNAASGSKRIYKLLAANKTSTMQKELDQLGIDGFEFRGQTVFESAFGGKEVVVIMEKDSAKAAGKVEYRLLATTKTSTMQKELHEAGEAGFAVVGMTIAKTSFGGSELVTILRK